MRTRALVSFALLSLPAIVGAQITRRPSTRTPIEPASPGPTVSVVGRDLAYKRARWALEGYSMFSAVQMPSAGGTTMSSLVGTGTHGDYRFTDAIAMTADATYAPYGTNGMSYQSAEMGTRIGVPISEARTRPFVDLRATFMNISDLYTQDFTGGPRNAANSRGRVSRGFGGFTGVGVEHALFGSFLLTTEVSALRSRMTAYRLEGFGSIPSQANYWSTMYRFQVGFRYNAQRAMHLDQNPRQ
jgi:hypothetical protein